MKYQGVVEFVKNITRPDGTAGHEIAYGPCHLEVDAESPSDARDKLRALANKNWRKKAKEVIEVADVRPVEPAPRRYFAFRFSAGEATTVRTGSNRGNRDSVAGQLYGFWDRKKRDDWVTAGEAIGEVRKVVKASKLPQGWLADYALDPETEELM